MFGWLSGHSVYFMRFGRDPSDVKFSLKMGNISGRSNFGKSDHHCQSLFTTSHLKNPIQRGLKKGSMHPQASHKTQLRGLKKRLCILRYSIHLHSYPKNFIIYPSQWPYYNVIHNVSDTQAQKNSSFGKHPAFNV